MRTRHHLHVILAATLAGLAALPASLSSQAMHTQVVEIVGNWVAAGGGPTFAGGLGFQEDHVERQAGPTLVDYLGIPLNAAGLTRALAYDSSLLTVPEHQCMPHPSMYSFWGPGAPRITAQVDESLDIVSYQVAGMFRRADRTIWMDGRPHPPAHAPHTWAGFTTGRWEGKTLVTETTHLKWGWIRRNGVATTDRTTVQTRYMRRGEILTITVIVTDPIYLTEPYIKTIDFVPAAQIPTAAFGVAPADAGGRGPYTPCYPTEEVFRDDHVVPHYLPWANPFLKEEEERHRLPAGATLGGADTALPDFMSASGRRTPLPTTAPAIAPAPVPARPDRLETYKVQGNVWMIVGAGANIVAQVGDEGVLLVDTGAPGTADAVLAALRTITTRPIRFIVNTSADPDHVGNNAVFGALPGGSTTKEGRGPTPQIIAHSDVLTQMGREEGASAYPPAALPTDAYLGRRRDFSFNGEAIQILHMPAAHGSGDSIVHFRNSDVIAAGDVYTTETFARFDVAAGGTIGGVIAAQNAILDRAVPLHMQEGGTLVVPGHGRVSDEADVVEVRDQVYMMRDRITDLAVRQQLPAAQVKARRALIDFEERYSRADWTTEQFTDEVIRSVVR
ncbi:MAG: MBL fold metallo-hydrolase [Vicinamibacterales bacterium]